MILLLKLNKWGKAFALNCDEDFMNQIRNICVKEMPDLKLPPENLNPLGGSDDFSYMMEYVQVHGGKATYMKLLTDITASPHNTSFNFNEEVLNKGLLNLSVYCLYIIKIKGANYVRI